MLKTAIMAFITYNLTLNRAHEGMLLNFISILFILPFFFLSATAGQLADKYHRDKIAKILKCIEFVLMLLTAVAVFFKFYSGLIIILFFMSTKFGF